MLLVRKVVDKILQVALYVAQMVVRPAGVHKSATLRWPRLDRRVVAGANSAILNSRIDGNVQVGDHYLVVGSVITNLAKISGLDGRI